MEKSEITEKQKLLTQKLEEAQVVLVGIGEEFNEGFEDIAKFPELMSALLSGTMKEELLMHTGCSMS